MEMKYLPVGTLRLWVQAARIFCHALPASSHRLILRVHVTNLWENTRVVQDLRAHLFHGRQCVPGEGAKSGNVTAV